MGVEALLWIACCNQKTKIGRIFKILNAICIKINFNGGQFHREISKFSYFNNLQVILKIV